MLRTVLTIALVAGLAGGTAHAAVFGTANAITGEVTVTFTVDTPMTGFTIESPDAIIFNNFDPFFYEDFDPTAGGALPTFADFSTTSGDGTRGPQLGPFNGTFTEITVAAGTYSLGTPFQPLDASVFEPDGFRIDVFDGGFQVSETGTANVVIPEPASLALLALGGTVLLGRRRRLAID